MKFESEFGLGEICIYNEYAVRKGTKTGDEIMPDILVKIVGITFDMNREVCHTVEHIGSQFGMQRFTAAVTMLTGDPDFDQEKGEYPEDRL